MSGCDDRGKYLDTKGTPHEKKCFLSGIARMRGGEGLARIKKYTLYIPFRRHKKIYKLPERRGGGGGEVIQAMPERKHFFSQDGFPYYADADDDDLTMR